RDPQRTVVTLNGGTRFAAQIRLAVASTSWVMAALEAMHPSISIMAILVMSKNTRLMSILTLAHKARNRNDTRDNAGLYAAACEHPSINKELRRCRNGP